MRTLTMLLLRARRTDRQSTHLMRVAEDVVLIFLFIVTGAWGRLRKAALLVNLYFAFDMNGTAEWLMLLPLDVMSEVAGQGGKLSATTALLLSATHGVEGPESRRFVRRDRLRGL
jgi:hypothetical protein